MSTTRDMLFVSHANPEDNEFARWITLQLANHGYGIWCDLTKLLGGERFWDDIEEAIRQRTAKFLYVLSKASNIKDSPRDELELAFKERRRGDLGDFIMPLWIDGLASADFNVRLSNVNAIRFQEGWRHGLAALLAKLEKDSVPKREGFGPEAVRDWWRSFRNPKTGVRQVPEILLSNWHPVAPAELYFHELHRVDPGPITLPDTLPYPAVQHNQYLVTLAPAEDMAPHLGLLRIAGTRRLTLSSSLDGGQGQEGLWTRREKTTAVTQLLNQAWQQMVSRRGLPTFEFANAQRAFYFRLGTAKDDRVEYFSPDGTKHWRNVVGATTQGLNPDATPRLRYWHFSLQARAVVSPRLGYMVKPHVIFSDDGVAIWESVPRLHRARRSHCKRWWNARWRDLLLGTMSWLAESHDAISLPVGERATISVSVTPLWFESPVSYDESELEMLSEADDAASEAGSELDEDEAGDEGDHDEEREA